MAVSDNNLTPDEIRTTDRSAPSISALAERYQTARAQRRFAEIAQKEGIVVVHFKKRTNGKPRRMQCLYDERAAEQMRYGYDLTSRDLMPVLDTEKGQLRMIPLDAVRKVMHEGEVVYERDEDISKDLVQTETGTRMELY
jgi:hypothetical protein